MALSADPAVAEAVERGNPVVFFDMTIGGVPAGRIKVTRASPAERERDFPPEAHC